VAQAKIDEVLFVSVRTLSFDAKTVERGDVVGSDVTVASATGGAVQEIKSQLLGQAFCVLE
jgi:hypothetical protein